MRETLVGTVKKLTGTYHPIQKESLDTHITLETRKDYREKTGRGPKWYGVVPLY